MSATCVPWYVPRGTTGLSKHIDALFPRFCPLNQSLARVRTGGGGYMFFGWIALGPLASCDLPVLLLHCICISGPWPWHIALQAPVSYHPLPRGGGGRG